MAPDLPPSAGEVKSNNQLVVGMPKAGRGWQESVDNHTTTMVGDDEQQERARNDEGNNEDGEGGAMVTTKRVPANREGKGGKGHGVGDEGGVQRRGQWQQQ